MADYRNVDCPNCGRHRVQSDGVCEKCFWDVDGDDYASITRPFDYASNGKIYYPPGGNTVRISET